MVKLEICTEHGKRHYAPKGRVSVKVSRSISEYIQQTWGDIIDRCHLNDVPDCLYEYYENVWNELLEDSIAAAVDFYMEFSNQLNYRFDLVPFMERAEYSDLFDLDEVESASCAHVPICEYICDAAREHAGGGVNPEIDEVAYGIAVGYSLERVFDDSKPFAEIAHMFTEMFADTDINMPVDTEDDPGLLKLNRNYTRLYFNVRDYY